MMAIYFVIHSRSVISSPSFHGMAMAVLFLWRPMPGLSILSITSLLLWNRLENELGLAKLQKFAKSNVSIDIRVPQFFWLNDLENNK
jgi:hypothetical protein